MKKIVFVLFISIISSQTYAQKRISFGVKLAGSLNFVGSTLISGLPPKQGGSAGVLSEIKIAGPASVRAEVLFANRGFIDKLTYTDAMGAIIGDAHNKVTLNYIDIPLMLKLSLGKEAKSYFILGGKWSVFLNGKIKLDDIKIPNSTTLRSSIPYDAQSYDCSAIGGFGMNFNIGKLKAFSELRYNHGFVEMQYYLTKFRTLELGLGLRF